MKIAFYETKLWETEYIKQKLTGQDLVFFEQPLNKDNLQPLDAEILVPFVGCDLSKEILSNFNNLKFIATRSTGYDHIDLPYCQQREVLVSNVPTYGEHTVAEFAFGLILTLSRKLYEAIKQVKDSGDFSAGSFTGFDLKGKTLGVVGTGHIGVHVIKIAAGFEMKILAFDPHPNRQLAKDYQVEYVDLPTLLKGSDIVTLHVPYLPATHHLINKENIKQCKRGALLINTSRGGLVETDCLVSALRDGTLGGAALDVLEEEGFIKDEIDLLYKGHPGLEQLKIALADHELMRLKNAVITPHTAFNTREAIERILDTTLADIKGFLDGKPVNLVSSKL